MRIPARGSFVTLACRDVAAMKRFSCDGSAAGAAGAKWRYDQFGWPPSEHNDDSFAAYRCGGAVLGLCGAKTYERFDRRDPEGNVWEVTWAEGTTFNSEGGLIFP